MKISYNKLPVAVVLVAFMLIFFVPGCAGMYGQMVMPGYYGMEVKLEELIQNYEKYHVYFSGPDTTPFAILFDPKDDQKNIKTHKYWEPIVHPTILKRKIRAMQMDEVKMPGLQVVKGYDNTYYGLMYTFYHTTTVVKQIEGDPKTVEVYPVGGSHHDPHFRHRVF